MAKSKRLSEKARIDLVGDLSDAYRDLICRQSQDPGEFYALGVHYLNAGMCLRGNQIIREAWEIDHRKYVPKRVIIEEVKTESGYGGTNETTLPVRQNSGARSAVTAFPDGM